MARIPVYTTVYSPGQHTQLKYQGTVSSAQPAEVMSQQNHHFPDRFSSLLYFEISDAVPQGTTATFNIDENSYAEASQFLKYLNKNIQLSTAGAGKCLACCRAKHSHSLLATSSLPYSLFF